jgi:6-pyruvoyltetrahydropterin/6-carboxytetrahydropterin synthase
MGAHDLKDSSNSESETKALPLSAVFELSQEFYFEAAHTLQREFEAESSRRIHGHTYSASITVRGTPDPVSGMLIDLAKLRSEIAAIKRDLDHQLLDNIEGLGPATLENLCRFIYSKFDCRGSVKKISVWREKSGDRCSMNME